MFLDLQKADMLKRASAWLLDAIVLTVLATGFALIVSLVIGYDARNEKLNAYFEQYENEYGISLDISDEEFAALEEDRAEVYNKAFEAMSADAGLSYQYTMVMNMTLIILSIGVLLAFAVSEFILPLVFKNGQTIGKKIFGIAVMQTNHTKITTLSLVIRTFLGKYAIETMVPLLTVLMIYFGFLGLAGTVTLIILILLQLAALIITKTNSAIHDIAAQTVTVDMKSQMIFENAEALENFKAESEENKDKKRGL